jgi:HEAT repeat protein
MQAEADARLAEARKQAEEQFKQAEEQRNRQLHGPDPSQPDYFEQMAKRILADDRLIRLQAIDALLAAEPAQAPAEARKQIARSFRELATGEQYPFEHEKAIRGLVRWAGKYSVPTLLDLLGSDDRRLHAEVYKALGELKDPRAAVPVALKLGDFFESAKARGCLREMGEAAEDAVIATALSPDRKTCLAAVQLLGEIGTQKSLAVLRKGLRSGNPQVRLAAQVSLEQVRSRQAPDDAK